MSQRITIKNFGGMKPGENSFAMNLTPSPMGDYYTSLTKMVYRKQKGNTNFTNLGVTISICTAMKEGIT